MRMPKLLNTEKLNKKFGSVTKSKDSIQNLSHWIIHHKAFSEEICRHWLNALKKSDSYHRLTLFYVANDVLQHCKKKNASEFRVSYAEVLEDAMLIVKNDKIKDEIRRMVTIWNERNVYSTDYLMQLSDVLNSTSSENADKRASGQTKEENENREEVLGEKEMDIIANFKTKNLISSLQQLKELRSQVVDKHSKVAPYKGCTTLPPKPWDFKVNADIMKKYEDLNGASESIENFIKCAESEIDMGQKVLRLLEQSQIFYSTQNEEVRRVVHAYRIFGKKLKSVQGKLYEKIVTLPENVEPENSPSPTVPCDGAPSPTQHMDPSAENSDQNIRSEEEFSALSSLDRRLSMLTKQSFAVNSEKPDVGSPDEATAVNKSKAASSVEVMKADEAPCAQSAEISDVLPEHDESASRDSKAVSPNQSANPDGSTSCSNSAVLDTEEPSETPVAKNSETCDSSAQLNHVPTTETTAAPYNCMPVALNKDLHLATAKTDCTTKSTFTCLKTPECSVQESTNNSKNSMLNLLEAMKLLSKLMPKATRDSDNASVPQAIEETAYPKTLPLSAIFKVMSHDFISREEAERLLNDYPASEGGVRSKSPLAAASVPASEKDDLIPMDMELDSEDDS